MLAPVPRPAEPVDAHAPPARPVARRRWSFAHLASFALFGLVTAAILAAIALILSTIEAERTVRAQAAQTSEALVALSDIERSAINAETGQRGFLITLDAGYLAPYRQGTSRYRPALEALWQALASDSTPRQRALVEDVERLADAKFAEMARSVALIEGGAILEAEAAFRSDEGQRLMVQLRATLEELETLEREQLGRAIASAAALEARIVPLLGALLGTVVVALGLGLWQFVRAARGDAAAAHARELGEARDRADLLARELNHRVKNLFAVILGIVRMSGKDVPEAKPVIERISERVRALVNAHEATQGAPGRNGMELRELIETAVAPYCSGEEQCRLDGDRVRLPEHLAMPLGLVLHELVTNAVKHGAWARPGGTVRVTWTRSGDGLGIDWREHCAAPLAPGSGREGFGSALIRSSARQLGGTIERTLGAEGAEVRIRFPLPQE